MQVLFSSSHLLQSFSVIGFTEGMTESLAEKFPEHILNFDGTFGMPQASYSM